MFTSDLTRAFFILLHEIFEGRLYSFTPTEIIFLCHLFYLQQKDFLLYGLDYKRKYYLTPADFRQYGIDSYEFYKATKSLQDKGIIIIIQEAIPAGYRDYLFNYEDIFSLSDASPIMKLLKSQNKKHQRGSAR